MSKGEDIFLAIFTASTYLEVEARLHLVCQYLCDGLVESCDDFHSQLWLDAA